jgi:hypothetical protein
MGEYPTMNSLNGAQRIVAIPEDSDDDDTEIRVWGFDENGHRVADEGKTYFLVPCVNGSETPSATANPVIEITGIQIISGATDRAGIINLWSLDSTGELDRKLGSWSPDEIRPMYRRIMVPTSTRSIRVKYRRRELKVSSMEDIINAPSRPAIMLAMKALKALEDNPKAAGEFLSQAKFLLKNAQTSANPVGKAGVQIDGEIGGFGETGYIS